MQNPKTTPQTPASRRFDFRSHAHTVLTLTIGVACILVGGAFLWAWFDPQRLAETRPIHLLGLLGLFLLPGATIAFQIIDKRRREKEPPRAPGTPRQAHETQLTHRATRHHRAARRTTPSRRSRRARPINE